MVIKGNLFKNSPHTTNNLLYKSVNCAKTPSHTTTRIEQYPSIWILGNFVGTVYKEQTVSKNRENLTHVTWQKENLEKILKIWNLFTSTPSCIIA